MKKLPKPEGTSKIETYIDQKTKYNLKNALLQPKKSKNTQKIYHNTDKTSKITLNYYYLQKYYIISTKKRKNVPRIQYNRQKMFL